jgi:4-amino-4-deoxy-L-arabinose transferase-like glycosyltransferase
LGNRSLWYDEAWSASLALLGVGKSLASTFNGRFYPPLHQVFLTFWVPLFGSSEISLRLLSALFGALSIPLVYLLGKGLHGRYTGLVAALLLGLSAFNIEFSREARGYSLFVFLATGSFLFFHRLLTRPHNGGRTRWTDLVPYLACTVLLPYCHLYGFLVVLAECLAFAIWRNRAFSLRAWGRSLAFMLLVWIPLAPPLFLQARIVGEGFWIVRREFWSALGSTLAYFGNGSGTLAGFLAALGLLGLLSLPVSEALLLLLWLGCLTAVPILVSLFATPIYFEKYAVAASPGLYLAAAAGVVAFPRRRTRYVLLVALLALVLISLGRYRPLSPNEDWRAAAAYVKGNIQSEDLVLLYEAYPFDDLSRPFQYYWREPALLAQVHRVREAVSPAFARPTNPASPPPEVYSEAIGTLPRKGTAWLVLTHLSASADTSAIIRPLSATHRLVSSREFPSIRVLELEPH